MKKYSQTAIVFIAFVTALILFAYSKLSFPEFLSKNELAAFINNERNGLTKTILRNDSKVKITFIPSSMLRNNPSEDFSAYYYFKLEVSKQNDNLERWYYNKTGNMNSTISILGRGFAESIYLVKNGQDTIYPFEHQFSRNFGIFPYSDFLYVFNKNEFEQSDIIKAVISLPELSISGDVSFDYNKILSTPKLKK